MSWLGPVTLLARGAVRRRRAALVVIVGAAAVIAGTTFTAAAGSRRTASVVDRMLALSDLPDIAVGTSSTTNAGDPERLRAAEIALTNLPGVEQAIAVANLSAVLGVADDSFYLDLGVGLDDRYLGAGWGDPLRVGRLPSGDAEVTLDGSTASLLGLSVGDELVAPTISLATAEDMLAGRASEPTPDGPELRFTVVGIFREGVFENPGYGFGVVSPDTAHYLGEVAATSAYFDIAAEDDFDPQRAVGVVDDIMGKGDTYFADPELELEPIRNTVHTIAVGLALFAILAATAGLIALGQVVGRQLADSGDLAEVAGQLGMRNRETAIALALPSVIAAGVGVVVGAVVAVAFSPIFPTGLGRKAELSPGVRVDWLILGVGSLVLLAAVSAQAALAVRRQARRPASSTRPAIRGRRSGLRRGLPLPAAIGSGLVLVPSRVRSGIRPASAVLGTVLGVAGLLAIVVFTVSQHTTANDPSRYGWSWDAEIDLTLDDPEPLLAALADEPELDAVAVVHCGVAAISDDYTVLCGMEVLAGSMPLTYHAGRAPQSPDEVVVGEVTMATHGLAIGDRVEVTGATGITRSLEVVGVAVIPDTSAPGNGLVTTPAGMDALSGDQFFPILTLRYAPGRDPGDVERMLAADYGIPPDTLTPAEPPALVERLALVRPTLVALAVFLAVLGVIGLAHFLLLSTARRRSETAVLKALGFVRIQAVGVVVWQALTIALLAVVVGAPLGVMIGRWAWVASVDQLGIIDTATVPLTPSVLVLAGALLGTGLVGLLAGWFAARRSPTTELRLE